MARLQGSAGTIIAIARGIGKVTKNFAMFFRPPTRSSARIEQLGFHRTYFRDFDLWVFFENLSRKFQFYKKLTRITSILHEDQYTFLIISRSILLRIRSVSYKSCRENQNTCVIFNNVFRKLCRLWDNVEKYGRDRQATEDNIVWPLCISWFITKARMEHFRST